MKLEDLRAFVAVVDHGGFRAAADALYLSQPTLTRRVQSLEAELGVPLLDRGPWGLQPTAHGQALLRGSRRIETLVQEVQAATVGAWDETVRFGAAATAAGAYLTDYLAHWISEHPTSRLSLLDDGSVSLRRRLAQRECDVAMVAGPMPAEFAQLPVRRATVMAIIPTDHPLAATRGPLTVNALHNERVLLGGETYASSEIALSACRLAGVRPEIVYEGRVWQTLARLAERGLGIAIVGDNLDVRGFDLPMQVLHDREANPLTFDLCVAWLRQRTLSPTVLEFAHGLSEFTRSLRRPRAAPAVAT